MSSFKIRYYIDTDIDTDIGTDFKVINITVVWPHLIFYKYNKIHPLILIQPETCFSTNSKSRK